MSRSGCRVAIQLHFRFSFSAAEFAVDKDGFVWISRLRMAESRSESADDAPCIAVPPEMLTLALGAGDAVLEELVEVALGFRGDKLSDMSDPAADGGALAAVIGLFAGAV